MMRLFYLLTSILIVAFFIGNIIPAPGSRKSEKNTGNSPSTAAKVEQSIRRTTPTRVEITRIDKGTDSIAKAEPSAHDKVQSGLPANNMSALYRWKESKNVTVISTEPPSMKKDYTVFLYSTETKEPSVVSNIPQETISPSASNPDAPSLSGQPLEVYTPAGFREFIRYSREIGEKIELRGEELNELVKLL